ncbi:hypothetical protein EST38_g2323 [Candolleomyces aberdarensis]|uniref:Glyoxal oxidase n=1 Tax=Candolleomyces aberdarensis TaxID=2316362 RepID=A0A4Q2DTA8_9AGAR|nr:hypothetical protein EST38_g2323 [Candolleomyces aberdarensis]
MHRHILSACSIAALVAVSNAQSATTIAPPGQPLKTGVPGGFEIIGESLVSAQQLFLGTEDKVYFVDKVEANPTLINNHPAWASEWALASNTQRPMDALTNSFCAGGNVLGNGTWLNVGGNQAVQWGGEPAQAQDGTVGPYFNADGRTSIRMLDPCDDGNCEWYLSPVPSQQRWYPTLAHKVFSSISETLQDGSVLILGGCLNGGYVNDRFQDNPTYQFFPPRGDGTPIQSPILASTLPANLYPLTWLLPSGNLLIQSNWATVTLNLATNTETPLDNIPEAVRVYPASAGTVMLPLTPANNYTATVLFCGGSNVQTDRWTAPDFHPPTYPASASCVKLTPDVSGTYAREDPLPEIRVMVNLIQLPDGKVLALNGGQLGTAGYGNTTWAIGHSYGDRPVMKPAMYDPNAAAGSKWSTEGLAESTVARMYHSSAVLLPDGSVMVSGSNPNPDYTVGPDVQFPTEYRTELWYPSWYNDRRPEPQGLLSSYSYGGPSFDVTLDAEDLFGDVENIKSAFVSIIRPGFSTHNMNMGQRFVQLESTYTAYADNNTAVLHVSQLPPNPSILAPGPALVFVTVKGVPSVGKMIMVGNGVIGDQPIAQVPTLVASQIVAKTAGGKDGSGNNSAAGRVGVAEWWVAGLMMIASVFALGS